MINFRTKKTGKKKIIVTSALPYVNNVPHLGTLICIISADVYSRFLRLKNEDVIYVLGTDEHGTTAEVKAKEEGLTPKKLVDKYFKIHKKVYDWFEIKPDCFGRTSSKENTKITVDIFKKLDKNGYIKEKEIEQTYCNKCKMFLSDRYVEGTCPKCKYEEARGDQCDNCGMLLDSKELLNPKCKLCGEKPVIKKTKHLFMDLPKIQPELKRWIDSRKKNWTDNARTMTEAWIKKGLRERAITRDIKWGIKVPKKGYEKKVFYSWFDAPIGYISITAEHIKNWEKLWKNPEKVRLVQFMGKDNIPFHTILFPSFLIGTKEEWTLMDSISVNEYLNYETGKFSKSRNQGVFADDAIKTGIKADVWRYYLMRQRPEKTDSLFTWDDFQEKINKELVANIGNLIHRTLFFIDKFYDSKIPGIKKKLDYKKDVDEITKLIDEKEIRKSLNKILVLGKKGNQYFQEQKPWETIKTDIKKCDNALANLVGLIKDIAILLYPFMPETSENVFDYFRLKNVKWDDLLKPLKRGTVIKKPKPLFNKLEDDELDKFRKKFSGNKKPEKGGKNMSDENLQKLNLKVGKIIEVKDHPNADKLYVLKVDIGGEEKQSVAGLKNYYKKEELEGNNFVFVINLEPAVLRGEKSEAMILAALKDDNLGLLIPENALSGEKVFAEGFEDKISEEQISFNDFKGLSLDVKDGKAYYENKLLKTSSGKIKIDKGLNEGKIM
ncbi:methionine--tRNA ligase [Candidatus Woesearchaeota archaeon]|nr:methionine--tRNA ligase [Candidatus Woesearchaeota archaeon]